MTVRRKVAASLYFISAAASLILGFTYLLRSSFMPYHSGALAKSWDILDSNLQHLLLALMDVAGAGWICLGLAILVLLRFPFRKGEVWARYSLPALILIFYVPTLLATLSILQNTPGAPPWYGNAITCLTTVLALLLDAPWKEK